MCFAVIGGKNFSHDRVDSYVKVGVDDVDEVLVRLTSANEIVLLPLSICPPLPAGCLKVVVEF